MPKTDTTIHVGNGIPSKNITLPFPRDWDRFSLTVFIDKLERQMVATFANIRV
jgi:hypothetical protein